VTECHPISEWIGAGVAVALLCVPMAAIALTAALAGRRRR
jgi:hypothetical protein